MTSYFQTYYAGLMLYEQTSKFQIAWSLKKAVFSLNCKTSYSDELRTMRDQCFVNKQISRKIPQ